jgi:NAD(P)-dependent dehydrogenase (short-subunit alcohol dehydrogenase family)
VSWGVTGARSRISRELADITKEQMVRLEIDCADPGAPLPLTLPDTRYFVLAAGVLHGKRVLELTGPQIVECLAVNTVNVLRLCEHILDTVQDAAICVVGSESAWKGSFDHLYAASKAAVHAYVKTRKVTGRYQQLVAIAPPIILDAGMTVRRPDFEQIKASARKTTTSFHVAERIFELLTKGNKQNEVVSM